MNKAYKNSIFIHRRDLRLQDNAAFLEALKNSEKVHGIFIIDEMQVGDKNSYRSSKQVRFMAESLEDLREQYKQYGAEISFFYGKTLDILKEILKSSSSEIEAVFINADYTPFAKKRDEEILKLCSKFGKDFHSFHDILLTGDPQNTLKDDGKPYTVFTPYWKKARSLEISKPQIIKGALKEKIENGALALKRLPGSISHEEFINIFSKFPKEKQVYIYGGRKSALEILKKIKDQIKYGSKRDQLVYSTSHLSPYIKFGSLSIREVYHAMITMLGEGSPLVRQLFWHDFYTSILHHFPYTLEESYDKKHNKLFWNESEKDFRVWAEGRTGFPIVDAGIRELLATGYMHNRARLIVGSFLTKDLHIYWKKGEQFFAQHLIDYDPAINNGNWQWVASTGVDPVPYFRIFNPWLQAKKFDSQAEYIKKWIPELRSLSADEIHTYFKRKEPFSDSNYPLPMVDHKTEAQKIKAKYSKE